MRAIIVCLIIFIVGYNLGNQRSTPSIGSSLDTITNDNTSNEVSYQASNYLKVDSLLENKQESLLYSK